MGADELPEGTEEPVQGADDLPEGTDDPPVPLTEEEELREQHRLMTAALREMTRKFVLVMTTGMLSRAPC